MFFFFWGGGGQKDAHDTESHLTVKFRHGQVKVQKQLKCKTNSQQVWEEVK